MSDFTVRLSQPVFEKFKEITANGNIKSSEATELIAAIRADGQIDSEEDKLLDALAHRADGVNITAVSSADEASGQPNKATFSSQAKLSPQADEIIKPLARLTPAGAQRAQLQRVDAAVKLIFGAMDQCGTDEAKIVAVLKNLSPADRQMVRDRFNEKYLESTGKSLDAWIDSELNTIADQPNRDEVYALLSPQTDSKAKVAQAVDQIYQAMASAGTDEEAIIDALASLKPEERAQVRESFNAKYLDSTGMSLDAWIDREFAQDASWGVGKRQMAGEDLAYKNMIYQMLSATGPIMSKNQMQDEMSQALNNYQAKHGPLSNSSNQSNSATLAWFMANPTGGMTETKRKVAGTLVTGHELALRDAVVAKSKELGRPIKPGELFELSLELNGGDVYRSSLCAHNMLRIQARGNESVFEDQNKRQIEGSDGQGGKKIFDIDGDYGRNSDPEFAKNYLEPIRGGQDEAGAWYHFFGTSTMAMSGGEGAAVGLSQVEERLVSADYYTDPLEYRADAMGARFGASLSERVPPPWSP